MQRLLIKIFIQFLDFIQRVSLKAEVDARIHFQLSLDFAVKIISIKRVNKLIIHIDYIINK